MRHQWRKYRYIVSVLTYVLSPSWYSRTYIVRRLILFLTLVHDLDGGTLNLSSGGRGDVLELERLLVEIKFALPRIYVDLQHQQHRCTIENGQAQNHNSSAWYRYILYYRRKTATDPPTGTRRGGKDSWYQQLRYDIALAPTKKSRTP